MDIEQLSKSQILLLVLLVTFVTSIATGIVTVSLMEKAPPAIAQTVNRVVERTVEKVMPSPSGQTAATVVTQEKTVIIRESDLIADAVKKISPSMVRVYTSGGDTASFVGLALVISDSGILVTDTAALGDGSDFFVAISDATRVRAFVESRDNENGLAFLRAATTTSVADGSKTITWVPASIATSRPVLGESVIALSGKSIARIGTGVVTAVIPHDTGDILDTSLASDSIMKGSPLINVDGSVAGVSTGVARSSSPTGFITASVLLPQSPDKESVKK